MFQSHLGYDSATYAPVRSTVPSCELVSIPPWIRLSYLRQALIDAQTEAAEFQSHLGYDSATYSLFPICAMPVTISFQSHLGYDSATYIVNAKIVRNGILFQSHLGYDSATYTSWLRKFKGHMRSFNPTLDTTQLLTRGR